MRLPRQLTYWKAPLPLGSEFDGQVATAGTIQNKSRGERRACISKSNAAVVASPDPGPGGC